MSAGAIGGCSGSGSAWADVRQAAADARTAQVDGQDDGTGRAHHGHHAHHGHRHHGGGHGLVQAIRQVLEKLGIGGTQTATEGDTAVSDGADTATTDAVAATDAVTASDATTPVDSTTATDAPADGTAPAPGDSTPSAKDVRHAVHAFIHALFQTLSQGGSGVQAAGTDADGDNDGCTGPACGGASAYRNPGTDLPTLVQAAGTDGTASADAAGTDAAGTDAAGAGPDLSALTSAFQDRVQALGGDPAEPAVTLQSFLQGLLDQLTGGSTPAPDTTLPPTGGLVSTTA
jgi:hypothetical protein